MTVMEIATLVTAIGSIGGLFLLHQRTKKSDAVVERSGIADEKKTGQIQRWEELESINERLHADNAVLRADKIRLEDRMDKMEAAMDEMETKMFAKIDAQAATIKALELELARVNKLVKENGS